jgi:hypothetical protein
LANGAIGNLGSSPNNQTRQTMLYELGRLPLVK